MHKPPERNVFGIKIQAEFSSLNRFRPIFDQFSATVFKLTLIRQHKQATTALTRRFPIKQFQRKVKLMTTPRNLSRRWFHFPLTLFAPVSQRLMVRSFFAQLQNIHRNNFRSEDRSLLSRLEFIPRKFENNLINES